MKVDTEIVATWLKGWAISRELPPAVKTSTGFKVEVNWPEQKRRYVFPKLTNEFIRLADSITVPWVFLKLCGAPDLIKDILPPRWRIQPQGYMMTCTQPMRFKPVALSQKYLLTTTEQSSGWRAQIHTGDGYIAAEGRIIFVDDWVIYDRITTAPDHQRKGLATIVMQTLERIALLHDRHAAILVATTHGRSFYESLGWELYSLYTSIVIPGS